jgi:hypothetical protein
MLNSGIQKYAGIASDFVDILKYRYSNTAFAVVNFSDALLESKHVTRQEEVLSNYICILANARLARGLRQFSDFPEVINNFSYRMAYTAMDAAMTGEHTRLIRGIEAFNAPLTLKAIMGFGEDACTRNRASVIISEVAFHKGIRGIEEIENSLRLMRSDTPIKHVVLGPPIQLVKSGKYSYKIAVREEDKQDRTGMA